MEKRDARTLAPIAQEELRMRVVEAIRNGMKKAHAAKVFGVCRQSIHTWLAAYQQGGEDKLRARKRGPKPHPKLSQSQQNHIRRFVIGKCPDQLQLPFALWTREAVRDLILKKYGIGLSKRTVGRYLNAWGFTPQKPARVTPEPASGVPYERNPKQVKRWLEEDYPELVRAASAEKALILWGDETGMRSENQAGRSFAPRGKTPTMTGTGKRFGCNILSAISNQGKPQFMVFTEKFTAEVFLRFLNRLVRLIRRKIILIVDRHPVHQSRKVNEWLRAHENELVLVFLPSYSPELNPDELLNQDLKASALYRSRPRSRTEMVQNARAHLRRRQHQPSLVRSFFRESHVRYAGVR
jgi:transposase